MIAWTFLSCLIGALLLLLLPRQWINTARWLALVTASVSVSVAVVAYFGYKTGPDAEVFQYVFKCEWIPLLGIQVHLAADGISLVLLLLTGLVAVTGILFSWNVEYRPKDFFAFFLLIIAGCYGVFLSFDLFLLFLFYELVIVPKYFLIAIWGSSRKEYGAMKLVVYSVVGSVLVLVGLVTLYVVSGLETFDLLELSHASYPEAVQFWAFPVLFLGFAILAGLWPFHTWAPTGHVAAPTAASMLLAGVVMKLGAYGALRVAMPLLPEGLEDWRITIAVLSTIGILYGAGVALVQRDLKFVIGYSSINHMGFVLLALVAGNTFGYSGAVLQMFSHGALAALLFAVVGRMIYDRAHTRDLDMLGSMDLGRGLSFAAVTFTIASIAAMGFPGFSGFIAELTILLGAWEAFPIFAILAVVGILITAAFTLRALQQSFFGERPAGERSSRHSAPAWPPITLSEKLGAGLLVATTLFVGLYPSPFLELILNSLKSPLMEGLI